MKLGTTHLWFGAVALTVAFGVSACTGEAGSAGAAGKDGAAGKACTVATTADGVKIECGDGTSVTVKNGTNGKDGLAGKSCTIADDGKGTKTITCEDGKNATVVDGVAGKDGNAGADGKSCAVKDNGDGTTTITCGDGTSATVKNGTPGADGKSCTVKDNGDGTKTIDCPGDATATVSDGAKGKSCTVTDDGAGTKTITCEDGTTATVKDGATGANANQIVNPWISMPKSINLTVQSITIDSPVLVKFTIKDNFGRGVIGLKVDETVGGKTVSGQMRFNIAKLVVPAADSGEPEYWKSYIARKATDTASGKVAQQATSERGGKLVDNGDGTYAYTMILDPKKPAKVVSGTSTTCYAQECDTDAPIPYEPSLTHRFSVQVSGTLNGVALPYHNALHDFVPNGDPVTTKKAVVQTASCNECHGQLRLHGSRIEVQYCVVCHNSGSSDPGSGNSIDLGVMTHSIHAAALRTANGSPAFKIGNADFSEVTYPQGLENCRKCHNGADAATPQGDYWKLKPTKEACGACHSKVDWAAGTGHTGGKQLDNKKCAGCHDADAIEGYHQNENNTPNNPGVGTGLKVFTYEMKSAAVDGTTGAISATFKITLDGAAVDVTKLPEDITKTSGPSFLIAYAKVPADATPTFGLEIADYNQLGRTAAQPVTVGLIDLVSGKKGTIGAPDANGYQVAKITDAASLFPAGAKLRAVALQGYYTQMVGTPPVATGRHTVSSIVAVTGDTARREIVDSEKCAGCHEWFEGHGGNRVKTVAVCVTCHNPNLSSSGRGASPANMKEPHKANATAAGYDVTNPLTFPEESMNFKDLIHSIHAAAKRGNNHFNFVRDRGSSGVYYYDFSEVTFPGILNNCQTCHKPGTYDATLPAGLLPSTARTTLADPSSGTIDGAAETTKDVGKARTSLPNATDWVTTPLAATCGACHATPIAAAHMAQNGAGILVPRATIGKYAESCTLCHAAGKLADVELVHAP